MAEPIIISNELWEEIEPLVPEHPPNPLGGAPRVADRRCLQGILHVLKTGCQWQTLGPCELWPSGSTCWRRFAEWTRAGVWPELHRRLLNRLGQLGEIDLQRVVVDSASVRAKKGALTPDPAPWTAGKMGVNATSSAMPRAYR